MKPLLRDVMQATRTQERVLHIKGSGYELFLDALEAAGDGATIDDVYDAVAPEIRKLRAVA